MVHVPDSNVHGTNMWPIWADRTQVGSMLAPWTLLSGVWSQWDLVTHRCGSELDYHGLRWGLVVCTVPSWLTANSFINGKLEWKWMKMKMKNKLYHEKIKYWVHKIVAIQCHMDRKLTLVPYVLLCSHISYYCILCQFRWNDLDINDGLLFV